MSNVHGSSIMAKRRDNYEGLIGVQEIISNLIVDLKAVPGYQYLKACIIIKGNCSLVEKLILSKS